MKNINIFGHTLEKSNSSIFYPNQAYYCKNCNFYFHYSIFYLQFMVYLSTREGFFRIEDYTCEKLIIKGIIE